MAWQTCYMTQSNQSGSVSFSPFFIDLAYANAFAVAAFFQRDFNPPSLARLGCDFSQARHDIILVL